jgi:hypothetical protein
MSCLLGINSPISITGDCGNTNSGAFSVDISGDAPAYTITWISGSGGTQTLGLLDTNYTVTGLSAGTYTFNIIDSCTPNNTYFVSVNISSGTCVSITGIKDIIYKIYKIFSDNQINFKDIQDKTYIDIIKSFPISVLKYFFV